MWGGAFPGKARLETTIDLSAIAQRHELSGGGIMNAVDALEFMLAGATAVQVGTASFINPGAAQRIAEDMEAWLVANGVADIKSLIGALET